MWIKIGIAVAGIIVVILGYAALQSPQYEVSRQITIQAPAEKIFPYLNNQKLALQWAPWSDVDPDAKMTFSGPDEGMGSIASWDGGKQLGTGSATIVESTPNQRVAIKLEYIKPMVMNQHSEYLLESSAGTSTVIWKVTGENSFFGRVMCLFMNMDKMVGGMFEKGLSKLKTIVEKQ